MATPTMLPPVPTEISRLPLRNTCRSCLHWHCWRSWRLALKIAVTVFYLVILFVCLPLLIWALFKEHVKTSFSAWFVAGIFMLLTLPIFLWGLMQHLLNYTQPNLQKHIIRILWIVPIYSIDSWMGLKFPQTAIYWNTLREVYEAYVLYNFLCYLLNFLEFENPDLGEKLSSTYPIRQPIPFCCLKPWPRGMRFIRWCKVGVLQYTVVEIVTTLIALVTQLCGVYDEGHFKLNRSYVYVAAANFASVWIALHSLLYFYKGTRHMLKPINPVGKFLTIKAIIFFSFWQSVLIALLVKLGALPNSWKKYDMDDVALGLQNFLICIEMLVAAVAHYFVFSHKPFIDPAAAQVPCLASCLCMLDVRDVYGDVKTHFVDPIPRPSLAGLKRSSGSGVNQSERLASNEKAPLLHSSPLPPPHLSPHPPSSVSGQRSFTETAEFSHLIPAETDITHYRTTPVVANGNSDVYGALSEAGHSTEAEL